MTWYVIVDRDCVGEAVQGTLVTSTGETVLDYLCHEWEKYERHHRARLAIMPGIAGLWQVSGRSNVADFERVVALDKKCIREWRIGWDIKILLQTVKAVLSRDSSM